MNKCKGESRKGRKPKGGKLVVLPIIQLDVSTKKSNIISTNLSPFFISPSPLLSHILSLSLSPSMSLSISVCVHLFLSLSISVSILLSLSLSLFYSCNISRIERFLEKRRLRVWQKNVKYDVRKVRTSHRFFPTDSFV